MISPRYGDLNRLSRKTNGHCHLCHQPAPLELYGSPGSFGPGIDTTTIDHVEPQSLGGGDDPENLMVAHASCNSARGNGHVEDARLALARTTRPPLSLGETVALGGGAAGVLGGLAFARRDQGESFNVGAGLVSAAIVAGAIALLS